ncbi:Nn.00g060160.m01.CDS01 [Neocucurbitaria sp. VM-36]
MNKTPHIHNSSDSSLQRLASLSFTRKFKGSIAIMMLDDKSPNMGVANSEDGNAGHGEIESITPRNDSNAVKRDLQRRHINMIAIAGMIGTGLFLASGQAIATAGPVGALFGYIVMGLITWAIALMTAEISAFMPVTGGFVRHAAKFVQPALGAATGWNFWYTMAITAPAELSAAATVINFWNTSINQAVWYSVFIVVIMALNFAPVKAYGESEVFFAALKIFLIIGLILAGIIVDLGGAAGQDRIGFSLQLCKCTASSQVVAIAGAETQNPRKIIPNALRMTFFRVLIFYVLSIFVVGLLIPYNDENLGISTGTAEQSPFVIAFQRAGIKVLPSIINTIVCMAEEGHAPFWFLQTNRFGTPYLAVTASLIFMPLVYLSLGSSSSVVFGWFVNITTVAGLIGWVVICATYLRFFYGFAHQGINRDRLPYKSPLQPYMAWVTLGALILVILFSGFSVFFPGHWSVSSFLTYYIDIAIFIFLWSVSWLCFKENPVSLKNMDLLEIHLIEQESEEEKQLAAGKLEKVSWWRKWVI